MTRDELVEELLPITRDFINQKRLSDAGCRTMLRFLLTRIELSKLNQPDVIKNKVSVCEYCGSDELMITTENEKRCGNIKCLRWQTVL